MPSSYSYLSHKVLFFGTLIFWTTIDHVSNFHSHLDIRDFDFANNFLDIRLCKCYKQLFILDFLKKFQTCSERRHRDLFSCADKGEPCPLFESYLDSCILNCCHECCNSFSCTLTSIFIFLFFEAYKFRPPQAEKNKNKY